MNLKCIYSSSACRILSLNSEDEESKQEVRKLKPTCLSCNTKGASHRLRLLSIHLIAHLSLSLFYVILSIITAFPSPHPSLLLLYLHIYPSWNWIIPSPSITHLSWCLFSLLSPDFFLFHPFSTKKVGSDIDLSSRGCRLGWETIGEQTPVAIFPF